MNDTPDQEPAALTSASEKLTEPRSRALIAWLAAANVGLVLVCGFGLYLVYQHSRQPRYTYTAPKTVADSMAVPTATPDSGIRQYRSTKLGISFSYPATWDVVEASDGQITVTSPDVTFDTDRYQTGEKTPVKGNMIVAVGKDANNFASGDTVELPSVAAPKVLSGSNAKARYLSFFGQKNGGVTEFTVMADTGATAYKVGQSIGAAYLPDIIAKVYPNTSIVGAYKEVNLECQSAPCRSNPPLSEVKDRPEFTAAQEIMKSVDIKS